MKFCSAVLEEKRIRDWEGRTDEQTDGHKDHYIPPKLCLRGCKNILLPPGKITCVTISQSLHVSYQGIDFFPHIKNQREIYPEEKGKGTT